MDAYRLLFSGSSNWQRNFLRSGKDHEWEFNSPGCDSCHCIHQVIYMGVKLILTVISAGSVSWRDWFSLQQQ